MEKRTFTGKELDATDLYYFGARYYDPGLGTFISSDPAMDGLNLYTYCDNNPLRYIDLWGLYDWSWDDANTAGSVNTNWCPGYHESINPPQGYYGSANSYQNYSTQPSTSNMITFQGIDPIQPPSNMYGGYNSGYSLGPGSNPSYGSSPSGNSGYNGGGTNNPGNQGYDFWADVTLSFHRVTNADWGYDSYQIYMRKCNEGNYLLAIGWWICSAAEFAYDTAFVWVAAEYAAGKAGYDVIFTNNSNVSNVVTNEAGQITEGTKVYRVWGDKANAWGRSWSTTDPKTVANYRNFAGLPNTNTGRFLSEGILKNTQGITTRASLPLDGNIGGLPEIVVTHPSVQIELLRVSGINPEF